jgi:hypothetical protein
VDLLKSSSDPLTRAQGQQNERFIGMVPRIRPEEVAGAPLEDVLPACFAQCEENGRWVVSQLSQRAS